MTNAAPTPGAAQIADESQGLVSPPHTCMRVVELLQDDGTSAQVIGEVIAQDPSLSARLLKLVNSSFYNLARQIDTLSRAVSIVGQHELYSLVIAVSAVGSFDKVRSDLINVDTFWRHSLYCALIARALAKQVGLAQTERVFVAGLLHDVGSLVLHHRLPGILRELVSAAEGDEAALHFLEQERLGFSHAELGGLLLDRWQLPVTVTEAIRCHHAPEKSANGARDAAIVHLAEALANHSEIGALFETPSAALNIDDAAWPLAGIAPHELDVSAVIGNAGLQFADVAVLIERGD